MTLGDIAASGRILVAHCSNNVAHSWAIDLDALIAKHGPTAKFTQDLLPILKLPPLQSTRH